MSQNYHTREVRKSVTVFNQCINVTSGHQFVKFISLYICHGLPDLPTSDRPTDDHLSTCRPLFPSLGLGKLLAWHPVFHWDHGQAVANFPAKSSRYHQMSPLVMSHPPCAVSLLNSAIISYKSGPRSRSQSVFG